MIRIAILDSARGQASRLSGKLGMPHRFVEPGPIGGPAAEVDAVVGFRFAEGDAQRLRFRLLQVSGAGLDGVALGAVPSESWVCNAYEHEIPIAEYVLLAMLEHRIGIESMRRGFRFRAWTPAYDTGDAHGEIAGATLLLVGYGHIGAAIAARARAFGMRVLAIASAERPADGCAERIAGAAELDRLLPEADFVVLACPLTPATRGLIDARRLGLMKPSAVLINVARGAVAVEADLYEALAAGIIGAAVIDAWYGYPKEGGSPVAASRFRFDLLPNVKCTPHASAWSEGLIDRRYEVIADNIIRLAEGRPLRNVVKPGV